MITLLENLKSHLPFSLLHQTTSFALIENTAQIAYYPNSTSLVCDRLFFIIKGKVEVTDAEELIDIYHIDDTFGGVELIKSEESLYQYIVTEELICYEIPQDTFWKLCKKNRDFKAYFLSNIVQRIEMSSEKKETSFIAELMVARVDRTALHQASIVDLDRDIVEALRVMENTNSSSLLIKNLDGYGIVTDADFRHYILNRDKLKLEKIEQIQTYPTITINENELLFNALLLMTERSIKHLLVISDENELLGILELIDVISTFSSQTHLVTVQIEKSQTLKALIIASKRVEVMIKALQEKGVKSRYIAKLVSEVNRKMYTKLFEMIMPIEWQRRSAFILLGSEGRAEQILRTDQDNALIFEDGFVPNDVEAVTQKFIEILDEIGFPRCEGRVMIINPKWYKSTSQYRKEIDSWIERPTMEGFMNMAIFFDSTAVAGVDSLHRELIDYLLKKVANHKETLPHFAKAIESFESSLGLFSRFILGEKEHKNELDIKKGAIFALTHGVRALALEYGIKKTNTTLRIKELNNIGFMNKEDAKNLIEALEIINTLRVQSQLEQLSCGYEVNNYISVVKLSKLQRDLLKEALKNVEGFKKIVKYHFHLGMVG